MRLAVWARDGAEEAGGAIADTLDALTSDRPYRKATSVEVALDRMARWAGGQLSPSIVAILLRVPVESSSQLREEIMRMSPAVLSARPCRPAVAHPAHGG